MYDASWWMADNAMQYLVEVKIARMNVESMRESNNVFRTGG